MNDFSEIENELKKLRPARPSPILFERVEQAVEDRGAGRLPARTAFGSLLNWWSLGFGLAGAAILVLFAAVTMERQHEQRGGVAESSSAGTGKPMLPQTEQSSAALDRFVPAGGTNVVYNRRDEGLHFSDASQRPVRRLRYQTQQTWRWRNPETGASLRVSYPSEEIVLIPVSGQ
jgi:hypothetical protein